MPAIYHHKARINEVDPGIVYEYYEELLRMSGFSVLSFQEYHFTPHGYTGLWLLGESHLAIHTFPEHSVTYRELSSCNLSMYQTFIDSDIYSKDMQGEGGKFFHDQENHTHRV